MTSDTGPASFRIRSYTGKDAEVCRRLFVEGLLGGALSENDPGLDIDDIDLAYMSSASSHFWVAETIDPAGPAAAAGEVVGMIGVQALEEGVGEIRRLRVRHDHRRKGIGSRLLETAIAFCSENGHLKIMLDTFMEREPALRLFEKFRFRHMRTRVVGGKELLYFYLDIYHEAKPNKPG